MADQLAQLISLIRVLTWPQPNRRAHRQAPRELARLIRSLKSCGWDEDATNIAEYCKQMPDFGRQEGEALLRRFYAERAERHLQALKG